MGYLKIKCHKCGGSWEAYHYNYKDDHLRMCPHCFQEIDRQTWNRQVVPAYGALEDANRELYKDHTGYTGAGLFTVEYLQHSPDNDVQGPPEASERIL